MKFEKKNINCFHRSVYNNLLCYIKLCKYEKHKIYINILFSTIYVFIMNFPLVIDSILIFFEKFYFVWIFLHSSSLLTISAAAYFDILKIIHLLQRRYSNIFCRRHTRTSTATKCTLWQIFKLLKYALLI